MKDFDEYLEIRVNIVRKMPRLTRPVSLHRGAANFMARSLEISCVCCQRFLLELMLIGEASRELGVMVG